MQQQGSNWAPKQSHTSTKRWLQCRAPGPPKFHLSGLWMSMVRFWILLRPSVRTWVDELLVHNDGWASTCCPQVSLICPLLEWKDMEAKNLSGSNGSGGVLWVQGLTSESSGMFHKRSTHRKQKTAPRCGAKCRAKLLEFHALVAEKPCRKRRRVFGMVYPPKRMLRVSRKGHECWDPKLARRISGFWFLDEFTKKHREISGVDGSRDMHNQTRQDTSKHEANCFKLLILKTNGCPRWIHRTSMDAPAQTLGFHTNHGQ